MTDEEKELMLLKISSARMEERMAGTDKALLLAKNANSALWTAGIALILGLANLLIQLKR
jgi:hypothetical protein